MTVALHRPKALRPAPDPLSEEDHGNRNQKEEILNSDHLAKCLDDISISLRYPSATEHSHLLTPWPLANCL